jgi:hypothetical protein
VDRLAAAQAALADGTEPWATAYRSYLALVTYGGGA